MARRRKSIGLNDPLFHPDHARPRTRREFLAQGFAAGVGTVLGSSVFARSANAALSTDISDLYEDLCASGGGGKIPFICFDLAGGANFAGSNVLIGGPGGQLDFLSSAGYRKQGLPGDRTPANSQVDFINEELGLRFHSESQMLRGILEKLAVGNRANVNGAVIPARSQNDTANNPHNPMYAIKLAGASGSVVDLIGSSNSDSGGNSMAPADFMMAAGPEARPTKVDNPNDVVGLVDTGSDDDSPLRPADTVAAMESMYRISNQKLEVATIGLNDVNAEDQVKDLVRCGYLKSTYLADAFAGVPVNPAEDPNIVGPTGIFSNEEISGTNAREFLKTASVMKMVVSPDAAAGAGTITMGGYDYHTGDREVGEARDLRVGRCIGAVLEYAARLSVPVMIYVCSDGSVFSNGMVDNSAEQNVNEPGGQGKLVWTGDDQQTAASFFLVYNPNGTPVLLGATPEDQARHQQLGYMRPSGDVETGSSPAANNVSNLVQTVLLNYMALHGEHANFQALLTDPRYNIVPGIQTDQIDDMIAFEPIV